VSEEEVDIVRAQRRPSGSFMVTIPREVVERFAIEKGEKLKVLIDEQRRRIIYELIKSK
jgi:bifunctional DNA-binding transcriptional regulator/antitoxin component of YhaV-PrlF toxin-antitoxin module